MPAPVNPANSISATNSGFNQCTPAFLRGASLPPNGFVSDAAALSCGIRRAIFPAPVAGSDVADVDKVIAPIDAGHQRFELATIAVPAADNHLVPGATLGLGPEFRSSRSVTSGGLF